MSTLHPRYNYTESEVFCMFLINAVSGLAGVPLLLLMARQRYSYALGIGVLSILSSFMYHSIESWSPNGHFILQQAEWHRLDNIGAISCLCAILIQLINTNSEKLDQVLNLFAFTLTMFCQEFSVWDVNYSVLPIITTVCLTLLIKFLFIDRKEAPNYNPLMLKRGGIFMLAAFVSFYVALDEFKDYLRICHGLWHSFAGIGVFHLW